MEAIAALHADSWRKDYRGAFLDSFLDGDELPERIAVWRQRPSESAENSRDRRRRTSGVRIVGFLRMILDEDPKWGTLLDNLHVGDVIERGPYAPDVEYRSRRAYIFAHKLPA